MANELVIDALKEVYVKTGGWSDEFVLAIHEARCLAVEDALSAAERLLKRGGFLTAAAVFEAMRADTKTVREKGLPTQFPALRDAALLPVGPSDQASL